MTLQQYILQGKERLKNAGLECADPLLHMKQIIEAVLGWNASEQLSKSQQSISQSDQDSVEPYLQRRLTGEPFQYIFGYEDFWTSRFAVGPGVLIPRPETEHLVEAALESFPPNPIHLAELGAGSGIIGITLLQERPSWKWSAWENHPPAVAFLKKNLALLENPTRYTLYEESFFEGAVQKGPFEGIVANPPYVKRGDLPQLSKEVQKEPRAALDGGESGLDCVEKLVEIAPRVLKPQGILLLEIGSDQGSAVLDLLEKAGFGGGTIKKDLAGKDRVAYGRLS